MDLQSSLNNIHVPRIKTFLSHTLLSWMKQLTKKETGSQIINIFHEQFDVGHTCKYIVIVSDGKSYDRLIKLKTEYGSNLTRDLPYAGNWRIFNNVLPIFMNIYLDAGKKHLTTKFHHGSRNRILIDYTIFSNPQNL